MTDLLRTLEDPHARHAMLVHLPIILAGLGFIPALVLLATKARNHWLRGTVIVWFLLASLGAGLAAGAGEDAEHRVEESQPALSEAEEQALERHEELGENGWVWPLIPAALVALSFVPKVPVRMGAAALAVVAAAGVSVWIAATAHAGGELVYVYGLGVPARGMAEQSVQQAPATTNEEGREADDDD